MDNFQYKIMTESLMSDPSSVSPEAINKFCDVALHTLIENTYKEEPWMAPLVIRAKELFPDHGLIRWISIARDVGLS